MKDQEADFLRFKKEIEAKQGETHETFKAYSKELNKQKEAMNMQEALMKV